MATVQTTIEAMTLAVGQVARETFGQFNNPLNTEFQSTRTILDSVFMSINGLRALLGTPRVVVTNNFHGVTAPQVPHLVDRANTALLRALGAG